MSYPDGVNVFSGIVTEVSQIGHLTGFLTGFCHSTVGTCHLLRGGGTTKWDGESEVLPLRKRGAGKKWWKGAQQVFG